MPARPGQLCEAPWLARAAVWSLCATVWLAPAAAAVPVDVPPAGAPTAVLCSGLIGLDLTGVLEASTRILSSHVVPAAANLPAYCEVRAYVWPQVQLYLWMPLENWSGRFVGLGCGGACGVIERIDATGIWKPIVQRGDVAMFTDMGHVGRDTTDLLWALDNPQAQIDYGFRATHVATVGGKAIAHALYRRAVTNAYFVGNSTGGRQGLIEAQRFPADYQGIVAKCPAITEGAGDAIIWALQSLSDREGHPLLTGDNVRVLGDAVLARCDKRDGVADGIVSDPEHCDFDPAEVGCERNAVTSCLSPLQVDGVRRAYRGMPVVPGAGHAAGGLPKGSEAIWLNRYVSTDGAPTSMWNFMMDWLQVDEPVWKELSQRSRPVSLADYDVERFRSVRGTYQLLHDASNPDLSEFSGRGGKLIMMQGMADVIVQPAETTRYYEAAVRTAGGLAPTQAFFRYFLMPGVGHCFAGDGPGADVFDALADITTWVEDGRAPQKIVALHLVKYHGLFPELQLPTPTDNVAFARPLFPYPARAVFAGGDWRRADSFKPVVPQAATARPPAVPTARDRAGRRTPETESAVH